MRLNKRRTDYGEISRRSIAEDFYSEEMYGRRKITPENQNSHEINGREDGKRISMINPTCEYARFARFFVGKLVRLISKSGVGDSTTGWYEFIHDEDRKKLNEAGGWSDNKKMYLLERPKFK